MKKRKHNLLQQIRQCGYLTEIYDRLQPDNDVYDAISAKILGSDYPVLPIAEEGEIATNKAFTTNLEDILLTGGATVKDSITAIIDVKGDILGDLHGAFKKSDTDKIKEYYVDTALCYGWEAASGRHILMTSSDIVLKEVPIIGRNNPLRHRENTWLDFDMYEIYRLFPRAEGYYVIKQQIDLSQYYVCPITYVRWYMDSFRKLAEENILLINYSSEGEDKVAKCTRCKEKIANKLANYLDFTPEKLGEIRVCDIEQNKIISIPIAEIVSYIVWQHY